MKRPRSSISKKGIDEIISTEHISEEEIKAISDEIKKRQDELKHLFNIWNKFVRDKVEAFFNEKKIKEKLEKIFENIKVIEKYDLLEKLWWDETYDIQIYGENETIQVDLDEYVSRFLVLNTNDPLRKVEFRKDIDNFQGDVVYYEEDTSFSDTLIRKWTKQEFIDRMNEIIKSEEDRKALFVKSQKEGEKLESMWYNVAWDLVSEYTCWYKDRFLKVLTSNQIENVKQIPEKVNEQKTNSALQLFSTINWLVKVEYKDDIYTREILKLIDEFTQRIEYEYLDEKDFEKILKNYMLWQINDPLLFYKFEKLKEQNIKNHYKRFYLYGKSSADTTSRKIKWKWIKKVDKESLIETKYVDDRDMLHILYFLKYKWGNISDLEADEEIFWKRVELSYKYCFKTHIPKDREYPYSFTSLIQEEDEFQKLSEQDKIILEEQIKKINYIWWREWQYFKEMLNHERNPIIYNFLKNNKIINQEELKHLIWVEEIKFKHNHLNWFDSHNLQNDLWIVREKLIMWLKEAQKEFVDELPSVFEEKNFTELFIWTNDHNNYLHHVILKWSANIRKRLSKAINYYDLDLESLKNKITETLRNCMNQWINFIKNKEKIINNEWQNNAASSLNYKRQVGNIVNIINELNNNLKNINYSDDITKDREMNQKKYIQEYFDWRKQIFVEKRIKKVLTMEWFDINQKDEMRKKMIKNWKEKLMNDYAKYIVEKEQKNCDYIGNYEMKNSAMGKMVNDTLFHLGYWALLKQIIPDDKERKIERQNIVRTITENCLKEIWPKLTNPKTFDDKQYYIFEPLLYLLKKYWWKIWDFTIKQKQIQQNYLEFVKKAMDDRVQIYFDKINKFISKAEYDKKSVESIYNDVWKINHFLREYLFQFIKKNNITLKWYEVKELFETFNIYLKNNGEYLGDYSQSQIDIFSLSSYSIPEIQKILSPEMNQSIKDIFHRLDKIKPEVWKWILSYRFRENAIPWGKLNRIVNEAIFEKFWLVDAMNQKQIDYVIDYLEKNLIEIILQDIKLFIFDWCECFESEKEIIKWFLNDFIFNWKERLSQKRQLGNRNQELGTGN